jgi:hypothetical protein
VLAGRHVPLAISGFAGRATTERIQARGTDIFRVVLSVFAPLTGVLLTLSLKPQYSHSIQIREER